MDENYLNSHNSLMHRVDDPFNQDIKKMKKRKTIFEQSISSSTTFSQKRNSQDDADSVSERNCCGCFFRYCRKTKYGTWDGVFLSCILSIIGVIMFLRLGYIVGQAGIWQTWIVEFVSALVVFLTTLSMSALCSNGEVKHGGAYYLISRSLGPEVGGSIGILFSLGKSIAVAMHTLGIAEPIVDQIGLHITNSKANELRVYGAIILAVLVIIAFIGVGWVIKIQFLMALILVVTIICFIVGCFVTVNPRELIVGVGKGAFKQNFNSAYTKNVDIIAIFGVFFPSMTGIMAGANISGDLANPSKSIPVGTLSAIITSWALYTLMSTFLGSTALRGNLGECAKSTPLTGICQNLIMERIAIPGQIIYAGIYAATISSALASLVGSTRILTKVANDKIVSFLTIFSKKRKSGEPLFAYAPVTIISLGCIMVGSINQIATLVTIAYLITYASINIACFQSSFSKSPGWRPTFKYYNKWVALISGLSCFVLIFVLNYIIAIPASIATFLIFLMIFRNSPNVDWGSANQGFAIMTIVKQLKLLNGKKEHVKNFRPNIIVFSQNPNNDHKLISFLYTLKHSHGANFIGIVQKHLSISEIDEDYFECEAFEKKFVLFRNNFETNDFFFGCTILLKTVGVGRIKPNTMFIKHPHNWREPETLRHSYFSLLCAASARENGIMIALNFDQLDLINTDPFGTIDVWWLYDDGGLSILLPHILTKSSFWRRNTEGGMNAAPLRLFIISKEHTNKSSVDSLMERLRLEGVDVHSVYPTGDVENEKKWEKVAELMHKYSKRAKIVFCTLPKPQVKLGPDHFFEIMDKISEDMPAMIMLRGERNVLTYKQE